MSFGSRSVRIAVSIGDEDDGGRESGREEEEDTNEEVYGGVKGDARYRLEDWLSAT